MEEALTTSDVISQPVEANEDKDDAKSKASWKKIKVDTLNKNYGSDPVRKKKDDNVGKNGFASNSMPLNPKNGMWWHVDYSKSSSSKHDPLKGKKDDPLRKKYGESKGIYKSNYPTNPKSGLYMGIDGLAGASAQLKEKKRKETKTVESHEMRELKKKQKLEDDHKRHQEKLEEEQKKKDLQEQEKLEKKEANKEKEKSKSLATVAAASALVGASTGISDKQPDTDALQDPKESQSDIEHEQKENDALETDSAAANTAVVIGASAGAAAAVATSKSKKAPATRRDPLRMKYGYNNKKGQYDIKDLKEYKVKEYKYKPYTSKPVRNDGRFIHYVGQEEYKMTALNAYWGWRPVRHATPVERPPSRVKSVEDIRPKMPRKRTNSAGSLKHNFYNDRFDRTTKMYMYRPYNNVKQYTDVKEYKEVKLFDKQKQYIGEHKYKMTPFNTYWGYRDMLHPEERERVKEEINETPEENSEQEAEEEKEDKEVSEEVEEEPQPVEKAQTPAKTPIRTPSPDVPIIAAAAIVAAASTKPKQKEEINDNKTEEESKEQTPKLSRTRTPSSENLLAAAAIVAVAAKDKTPTPKPATPKAQTPKPESSSSPQPRKRSRSPSPNLLGAAIIAGAVVSNRATTPPSPTPNKEPTPEPLNEHSSVSRSPSLKAAPLIATAAIIAADPTPTPKNTQTPPPAQNSTPSPPAAVNRRIISPDPVAPVVVAAAKRRSFDRPAANWDGGGVADTPPPLPGPAENKELTMETSFSSPSPPAEHVPAVVALAAPRKASPRPKPKSAKKSQVVPQQVRPDHQKQALRPAVSTPVFQRAKQVTPAVEQVEENFEAASDDVWTVVKAGADSTMTKISRLLKL